jgi:hypothetical protein
MRKSDIVTMLRALAVTGCQFFGNIECLAMAAHGKS